MAMTTQIADDNDKEDLMAMMTWRAFQGVLVGSEKQGEVGHVAPSSQS